jgi:multiple sugar transport system substrate-binding protein
MRGNTENETADRTFALGLTTILSAGIFVSGCAGKAEPKPAPAAQQPAPAQNAKPYQGVTIRFLAANHPWTETIKKEIPAFEEKTGIKVNMEAIAENQLTQKVTVELTAGAGTIDVFMQRPLQEAKLFEKNGWYADLNPFVKDTKKTPADYDVKDFFQSTMEVETINGKVVGIPLVTEQEILYYRKDLFQAKGIKVPTTMAELEDAAKKLNDPANGMSGIVMRGKGNPATTQFSSFLYSMGGEFIKNGKFVLDSPEAVKAFQTYGNLLGKYGPQGVLNMEWPQAAAVFAQGKAAMWVDANSLFLNVTDPAKSTVADKVGFAMIPAGDKGALPYSVTSWGLSVAKSSKQQDAAWEFIKWATSKEMVLKTQAAGNPSARASVWLFPFVWMFLSSFKTQAQIMATPPQWVFKGTFRNYVELFEGQEFGAFILNSMIIGAGATLAGLVLGLPAAYSIARNKQAGLGFTILVARIVPGITFLIPWFMLFTKLHMVDTIAALVLTHMLVTMPFIVWVMVPFFEGIPGELIEAARVDGCTEQYAFARIVLPISGPGIITASILAFVFSWNNFMFSVILSGAHTKTLPVAIFNFLSYSEINWGGLMAAAVIVTLPVLVLALAAQKYIVRGLTAGAVKG